MATRSIAEAAEAGEGEAGRAALVAVARSGPWYRVKKEVGHDHILGHSTQGCVFELYTVHTRLVKDSILQYAHFLFRHQFKRAAEIVEQGIEHPMIFRSII